LLAGDRDRRTLILRSRLDRRPNLVKNGPVR